jgi:hypothetical protein
MSCAETARKQKKTNFSRWFKIATVDIQSDVYGTAQREGLKKDKISRCGQTDCCRCFIAYVIAHWHGKK